MVNRSRNHPAGAAVGVAAVVAAIALAFTGVFGLEDPDGAGVGGRRVIRALSVHRSTRCRRGRRGSVLAQPLLQASDSVRSRPSGL